MIAFVRTAACAAFVLLASHGMMPAWAGAADYRLESVAETVPMGSGSTLAIRLLNGMGSPVNGVQIVDARLDMAPQGMPEMVAPLQFVGSNEPGVYLLQADLPMAGGWRLTVSARIPGEADALSGELLVTVVE